MDLLNKHVSIRRFQDREIEDSLLEGILYSGARASTTGNMQLYSIIVTKDAEMKQKQLPLHFNQPTAVNAPVLLTFVADFNRFNKWCLFNGSKPGYDNFLSFMNAAIDTTLAAQNVCIAAEAQGLGICYLGTTMYNAKEMIELLNLPKHTFPVTTIAIGYPAESPELTDRLPLKGIVHSERYNDYSKDDIDALYAFKENLESSRRFVAENEKNHLSEVFTDIRYKKADNEFFSQKIHEVLVAQGFLSDDA